MGYGPFFSVAPSPKNHDPATAAVIANFIFEANGHARTQPTAAQDNTPGRDAGLPPPRQA